MIAAGEAQLVLTAVLPGARVLRGDGELIAGLAAELAGRAAKYLAQLRG